MFVRPASPDDLESIRSFDEWNVVTEQKIADGHCFVAGQGETILAYGILDRSFFGRRFASILFVAAAHRQGGLGEALLQDFESRTGDDTLWISTNIENLPMQRLLHKRGYTMSGVINDLGKVPELVYHR